MIRPAFHIQAQDGAGFSSASTSLVIEIHERQLSFAWINKIERELIQLSQYHLNADSTENDLVSVLQELIDGDLSLQEQVMETTVIYNFGEASLVPEKYYSIEICKPVVELSAGNVNKGLVLSEKIKGSDIYSVYRIPKSTHGLLQRKFSAGKYWHCYSLLLSEANPGNADPLLKLYFYPDKFILTAFRNQQILLAQRFAYQVPEDVSYHLLSVCRQFDIEPGSAQLLLTGLIDRDSALHGEIERYFLHIDIDTLGTSAWKNQPQHDYPPHYFSPLLQMALCV